VNTSQPVLRPAVHPAAHPNVQYEHTAGVVDLTWGHPDPSALASEAVGEAALAVLACHGWESLAYGAPCGAAFTRAAVAALLSRTDTGMKDAVAAEEVVICAGSSGGLDLLLTLLARPGDVVFVERPTYFLALRMFADHNLQVIGLASDRDGPSAADLEMKLQRVGDGKRTFLYLVPTFANPTGRSLADSRIDELLVVAGRCSMLVIEDDVYRDTAPAAPKSMWSRDRGAVVRLGSFSKSLAPGLRVGFLTAGSELVERIGGCGLLDSGGGLNHFASMLVGELLVSGRFDEIAAAGQRRYAERCRALAGALDPTLFTFTVPAGGYFLWLALPTGVSAAQAVSAGREQGVLVSDGDPFLVDAAVGGHIRVSFSMLDVDLLREGATRLNRAIASLTR
jgi:DNA-binding transcriptional MocR family regulator